MLPFPPLLLITDRGQSRIALLDVVAAALAGGVRWISVREKDLADLAQIALAGEVAALGARFGARVTLHGTADLAARAGLDGVHLAAGADAADARARLGAGALIGQSVHAAAEAAEAEPGVLDYVVAGPAFATASKPGYGPALEADGLRHLVGVCRVPLLALGGIDAANAARCKAAGAQGIAVMGGLMRAPDPEAEARALLRAWSDAA
ncbi:thiamine phosphate synthase [Aquabacter spiritensis]|uniref:Thiamine-phosphate pyrophosphorylase n=1 Tax=Aquabacter spiritensis TaxID=933073 RepID=A0A4R3LRK2_9HYPH|nr:thiamine phosphate synthase [Aquabacter spiritensis]TCT03224.1 thiamine-phosphate pyrophosphorylase [Aquabacter spiritensis]